MPDRNPDAVIDALRAACAMHPTQRVMQVIVNAIGVDPFYVEDDHAAKRLNAYAEEGRPRGRIHGPWPDFDRLRDPDNAS